MNTSRLSENTVNLIRDLALAFGPSGLEDGAAEVIRAEAEKIPGATVSRDPLGSVILHLDRSAPGVPGKKLLFTAGMDEQSFMLTERTGDGDRYFRAKGLGRVDHRALYSRLMLLGNEETQIPALFGGKPLHLTEGGERTSPDGSKLFLDPCTVKKKASPKEDASEDTPEAPEGTAPAVEIGDFATFAGDFLRIGEEGEYFVCKALETRCPCALLLETAAKIAALPEMTPGYDQDFYFVFAVKEQAGMSGAAAAAQAILPDACVSVGFAGVRSPAPGKKEQKDAPLLGGGVFLPLCDGSTLYYDSPLRARAADAAREGKIPFTEGKGDGGIGRLHLTGGGIPVLRAELPCCNPRTGSVIVKQSDLAALAALLEMLPTVV